MSTRGNERDYYSILSAAETASQREIERLYKILAWQHHPDRGGDAEEMKAINEAYRVLRSADTRRSYDSSRRGYDSLRQPHHAAPIAVTPPLSPPSTFVPDSVAGRLAAALFFLLAALVFLFVARIYYIRFMWPLVLVAMLVVVSGVWKVHKVIVFARKSLSASHPAWRYIWLQELIFWSVVCGGAYGIYVLMRGI